MRSRSITVAGLFVLACVLAPIVVLLFSMVQGKAAESWEKLDQVMLDRATSTLVLALGATIVAVALALPFSLVVHRARFFGRSWLRVLYILPLLIPPHIQAIAWMRVLGRQGNITEFFSDTFGWDIDVRAGFFEIAGKSIFYPGATWMLAAVFWPLAALIISAGLKRLDPSAEEAALLVPLRKASAVDTLRRFRLSSLLMPLFPQTQRAALRAGTLPALRQHILGGAFFVFIFATSCYPVPALLDTPTIMIDIFMTASQVSPAAAGIVGLPLVAMNLLALAYVAFLVATRSFNRDLGREERRPTLSRRTCLLGSSHGLWSSSRPVSLSTRSWQRREVWQLIAPSGRTLKRTWRHPSN